MYKFKKPGDNSKLILCRPKLSVLKFRGSAPIFHSLSTLFLFSATTTTISLSSSPARTRSHSIYGSETALALIARWSFPGEFAFFKLPLYARVIKFFNSRLQVLVSYCCFGLSFLFGSWERCEQEKRAGFVYCLLWIFFF